MDAPMEERKAAAADPTLVSEFWSQARKKVGWAGLEVILGQQQEAVVEPPWMQLSEDRVEATEYALELGQTGKGNATVPLTEFPGGDEDIPKVGDLTIICDGDGKPRVLVMTVDVVVHDADPESDTGRIVEEKFRSLYPRQKEKTKGH